MRLHYGIHQGVRFYEKLEHQNRFRAGGEANIFKLLMPSSTLLPFQIKREGSLVSVSSIKAVSTETGAETELINRLGVDQLKTYALTASDYVVHFGTETLSSPLPEGDYYLEVTDGQKTWYSEELKVRDFDPEELTGCAVTRIVYWNTCDVSDIFYRTTEGGDEQYKNIIYLDLDVGRPEYDYTEEGEENGQKQFEREYAKREKEYYLQGVFPEYMVDALTLIPLHLVGEGAVEVKTSRGYVGSVDRMTVAPEWPEKNGVWALTDILFSTESILKSGCCGDIEDFNQGCFRDYGYEVVARLLEGSTDYNAFQYTSAATGNPVPLEVDDVVLVEFTGPVLGLQRFNGSGYSGQIAIFLKGDNLTDLNELNGIALNPNAYYFHDGTQITDTPIISSILANPGGTVTIQGATWNQSVVKVISVDGFGQDTEIGQVPGDVFNSDGFTFTPLEGSEEIYLEVEGLTCKLGESTTVVIPPTNQTGGVSAMSVNGTFKVGPP